MIIISALHNMSRSLGYALLGASTNGRWLVVYFIGGEMTAYLIFKVLRQDFLYWVRFGEVVSLVVSIQSRICVKIITDFTGCLHFRHPFELGGVGFSLSMTWAQIMPFVAMQLYDGKGKDMVTGALVCSFALWLLINTMFFCTIDLSYVNTFFGTMTAPQYTCMLSNTSKEDSAKFDAIFSTRLSFSTNVHEDVKDWVAANVARWNAEGDDWFKIEMIPDEFLPKEVLEAEGGAQRRRNSVSVRETLGFEENVDER